jgi:thymidylate synthase ThyX
MKNITLSVDERAAEEVREIARSMGKSVNQLIREYFDHLSGHLHTEREIAAFVARSGQGNSAGWKFNRDEIHDRKY